MNALELNELCGTCGHEYRFHVDAYGTIQPCDVEPANLNTADEDVEPELCGCPQFVQVADPEEIVPDWKCRICGAEGGEHGPGCVLHPDY